MPRPSRRREVRDSGPSLAGNRAERRLTSDQSRRLIAPMSARSRPATLFVSVASVWWLATCSPAAARPASLAGPQTPVFVFQDSFWVNLHHFLRAESRREARGLPLEWPVTNLAEPDRAAWEHALAVYRDLADRSLLFDKALVSIDNLLGETSDTSTELPPGVDRTIATALTGAAPAFRRGRWTEEHQANRAWIVALGPAIADHASTVKAELARVFNVPVPRGPILVDVVRDVGPNLAYTTVGGPTTFSGHTFVSPQANANPEVAVDTLLHEISHTMDAAITSVIDHEAAREHVTVPADLWHAMTLYTTHELVRRAVGRSADDTTYAPNLHFPEMFAGGGWPELLTDLRTFWQPHLDGKQDLATALRAVVEHAPRGTPDRSIRWKRTGENSDERDRHRREVRSDRDGTQSSRALPTAGGSP